MSMIVPEALRDLVGRWRANGSPTQPGIGWARQKWVGSFPEQRAELGGLPDLLDRASVQRFCLGAAADAQSAETAFVAI